MKTFSTIHYICLFCLCLCMPFAKVHAQKGDFGGLNRYAQENKKVPQPTSKEKRVVFMGNSITEGWVKTHRDFFSENGYIGRGISGQTSSQFLVRFREDVIKLSPALVVINAGTNDIAENTGPYNEEYTFGNIISMVELAQAHKIKVILTSVLPAARFDWNPSVNNIAPKIASLNARIRAYAEKHHLIYVDYYTPMVHGEDKALNPAYTHDGVHPIAEGYAVMEPLIKKAIEKSLNRK